MIGKIAALGLVSLLGLSAFAWRQPVSSTATPSAAPSATGKAAGQAGAASVPAKAAPAVAGGGMLPERMLECRLSRITNFNPAREQAPSELTYEGDHRFALFLPSIPVRTTEPPRSTLPPEPVDPRTRIVADPDGISAGAAARPFERVVDYWPERVEMTTPIGNGSVNLIILQRSQAKPGLVDLFMTRATDAVSWDEKHIYSGHCKPNENGAK
jgi:hypothetical protein